MVWPNEYFNLIGLKNITAHWFKIFISLDSLLTFLLQLL